MLLSNWICRLFCTPLARRRIATQRDFTAYVQSLESRTLLTPTLTVTNTNDSGTGSLRDAIAQASGDNDGHTIIFASNLAGSTIKLTSGELDITGAMTITGLGANQLTIDGGWDGVAGDNVGSQIFNISQYFNGNVAITGLTLTHGNSNGRGAIVNGGHLTLDHDTITNSQGGGISSGNTLVSSNNIISGNTVNGDGGGVVNDGIWTSTNDTISANTATDGGGVYCRYGTWMSTNDTIFGNTATAQGGGVDNNDVWTSTGDLISGNSAGGDGGGIDNGDQLISSNDTISGNTAAHSGGGVENSFANWSSVNDTISENSATDGGGVRNNSDGMFTPRNDTIFGNMASSSGGGIYNISTLSLTNNTIFGNTANLNGGGIYNDGGLTSINTTITENTAPNGGGLYTDRFGSSYVLNTILSGNSGGDVSHNPIANITTSNLVGGDITQILATDAGGTPLLANNGGPTKTVALIPGSSAIGNAAPLATLSQNLLAGATATSVTDTTFLAVGQQFKIDNEIVTVTAMSGKSITITRASGGGTNHNSGAPITLVYDQTGAVRTANDIGAVEQHIVTPTAPTINAPATVSVNHNSVLAFSGANLIAVADLSGTAEQLTLSVTHGTLSLDSTTGVTGNGTSTLAITGTLLSLNSILSGLKYTPNNGYQGADTLSLSNLDTSDNLTGTGSVAITVNSAAVNHSPIIEPETLTVAENSVLNTAVGNVVATDPDLGQALTFSIDSGNVGNAFAINPTTGALTVANAAALNFETNPSFQLSVKATDNGTPTLSASTTITINLTDVNEAPLVPSATFSLAENTAVNSIVGNVTATDPDFDQTVTFSIAGGNLGNAFVINPTTGALAVASSAALNFETNSNFQLSIKVTDNGTPALSTFATVVINLTDVNEAPKVAPATFTLAENLAVNTFVGNVTATDPDSGQASAFSIVSGNVGNAFAINPTTGALTVANSSVLNFEANPSFQLSVKVTDNGTPALAGSTTITVNLTDVNEAPVVAPATFSLGENSAVNTIVGNVTATDPDPDQTLTFSIAGGNVGNAFVINPTTGALTVSNAAALKFATNPSFQISVRATDNGTPALSASATITINLNDVNQVPVIVPATFSLAENAEASTAVGNVTATDPDVGQTLTFSIVSGNVGNAFAINATTGALTVANAAALNFAANPTFQLSVSVTDNGTPPLSASTTITINLTDVNQAPIVAPATFSVPENSAVNTTVGIVSATDPNAGQTVTFSIVSGNFGNAFAINLTTGALTVTNPAALNFETNPSFQLSVKVTDNGTPALSASSTITINLIEVNQAPVVVPATFSLPGNSAVNTAVGTVSAMDPDAGQTLSFSIVSGNVGGAFAINPVTGALTVANSAALNFEVNPTFHLTVRVTDNGTPSLEGTGVITINLTHSVQPITLSGGSGSVTYLKASPPVKVLPDIVIEDGDETSNLSKVEISFFVQRNGLLSDYNIGNLASLGTVTQSGATNFKKASGTFNLTITFNPGVTDAEVQQSLRGITFQTAKFDSKNKPLGRKIEVEVIDGRGIPSNKITTTILARTK
ncbi:MAG: hypothetical protein JWM11_3136 [Planctomycetaceae bacterium]|nr:hypothetical protein [Planctomycetaceae bacterium]